MHFVPVFMQAFVLQMNMIRIRDIKLNINAKEEDLLVKIADVLMLQKILKNPEAIDFSYEILKKSIDARKKPEIFYIYTVKVLISDENEKIIKQFHDKNKRKSSDKIMWDMPVIYEIPECGEKKLDLRPVVVGSGPAGLFCALNLARRGFKPIIAERGQSVDERSVSVEKFWEEGVLNTESNVQFGEGGAGTFSDGKLNTLTKDTYGRNTFVLKTFHEFGAPVNITYDSKPHIGTDVLKTVVKNIRRKIESLGGTYMFNTKLIGFNACMSENHLKVESVILQNTVNKETQVLNTDNVVLAIGHSSRDTLEMLFDKKLDMNQKSFAAGFRVVHPQKYADEWAYGQDFKSLGLGAADYKVTNETSDGRRVYSFCMCPGGFVVNASSEEGNTCVNGMSYSKRDSGYANSAIIASIEPGDFVQDKVTSDHPLAGMYYQRSIENKAFMRANGNIPAQRFCDFEEDIKSNEIENARDFAKGRIHPSNLRNIFSEEIDKAFIESMHKFGYTRKYFDSADTVILGVEARTSSPVRINRDEKLESNIKGIYPCGEGAGYAGGITSAAADGLKVSEEIIKRYTPAY